MPDQTPHRSVTRREFKAAAAARRETAEVPRPRASLPPAHQHRVVCATPSRASVHRPRRRLTVVAILALLALAGGLLLGRWMAVRSVGTNTAWLQQVVDLAARTQTSLREIAPGPVGASQPTPTASDTRGPGHVLVTRNSGLVPAPTPS